MKSQILADWSKYEIYATFFLFFQDGLCCEFCFVSWCVCLPADFFVFRHSVPRILHLRGCMLLVLCVNSTVVGLCDMNVISLFLTLRSLYNVDMLNSVKSTRIVSVVYLL